jgi:hypothetical protein
MSSFVRRIFKFGPLLWNLVVSAAGGFVFMRGFRLVALGKEGSDSAVAIRTTGLFGRPMAGIGAALFLLVFVSSEALATIRVLLH